MFDTPPTQYEVSFRFLGFPIRVHPSFWIIFLFLSIRLHSKTDGGDWLSWIVEVVIWIAAIFVSLLAHELGHALVFRYIFRVPSSITLFGLFGITEPDDSYRSGIGLFGLVCDVLLYAAGCLVNFLLAGFFLAGCVALYLVLMWSGFTSNVIDQFPLSTLVHFVDNVIYISIILGIFNLLPVQPMDGGIIIRKIFSYISPRFGTHGSLILSMIIAIVMGVFAFRSGMIITTIFLAYFAYLNYREFTETEFLITNDYDGNTQIDLEKEDTEVVEYLVSFAGQGKDL